MHDQLRRSVDRIDERKVLRRLNLRLSKLGDDAFTTAAVLTYFPPTRRMSISYAGHEPAWYYVASTQRWLTLEPVERKGLANLILAVSPRSRFTRCVRRVTQGDRLLMITDGVLEAMNRAGALFGRERLAQVIQSADSRSPETVVSTILDSLHEHTEGAGLNHDDVSILLLEFVDNLEKPAQWLALQNRLFRRRSSPHHAGRSSMGNDGLINGGGQVEAREEASVNRALLSGRTAAEAVLAKAHEI
jgi:serine phosphatase RsbU (regulator of sigma subunit)